MTRIAWSYPVVLMLLPSMAGAQPDASVVRFAPQPSSGNCAEPGTTAHSEPQPDQCARLPAGKRIMNLDLKPDTAIMDVIGWISSITCEWFEMSQTALSAKKVTVASPRLLTTEESYDVFLASLDSVGLTLEQAGKYQRVVEITKYHIDRPRAHFPKDTLDKLVLLAVIQGTSGTRAVLGPPEGRARIIKPGDRVSIRAGLVREILPDRLLVEISGSSSGARRTQELVLKPELKRAPAKAAQ